MILYQPSMCKVKFGGGKQMDVDGISSDFSCS